MRKKYPQKLAKSAELVNAVIVEVKRALTNAIFVKIVKICKNLIFGRTVTSHGVKVLCVLRQSRKTFTEYIFIRHKVNIC